MEEQDFERVFHENAAWLHRFCDRNLPRIDADDGFQEIMLRVSKANFKEPDPSVERTYLIKAARSYVVDYFRRKKAAIRMPSGGMVDIDDNESSIDAWYHGPRPDTPEQLMVAKEYCSFLNSFLGKLSQSERTVLIMKSKGYTEPEIATELDRNTGTIKSGLHRIRTKILETGYFDQVPSSYALAHRC